MIVYDFSLSLFHPNITIWYNLFMHELGEHGLSPVFKWTIATHGLKLISFFAVTLRGVVGYWQATSS